MFPHISGWYFTAGMGKKGIFFLIDVEEIAYLTIHLERERHALPETPSILCTPCDHRPPSLPGARSSAVSVGPWEAKRSRGWVRRGPARRPPASSGPRHGEEQQLRRDSVANRFPWAPAVIPAKPGWRNPPARKTSSGTNADAGKWQLPSNTLNKSSFILPFSPDLDLAASAHERNYESFSVTATLVPFALQHLSLPKQQSLIKCCEQPSEKHTLN